MNEQTDCTTDAETFGHRRDPSYRRGFHEGASAALRLVDDGWTPDTLGRWLADVGQWRYDEDAGPMPPMPPDRGGGDR